MQKQDVIRQRLMRQRHDLLARYTGELARADEVAPPGEPELVERASEEWEARVLLLLGDADRKALGEVAAALQRLDAGDYGRCIVCNERIPDARLEALPATAACVACAEDAVQPTVAKGA